MKPAIRDGAWLGLAGFDPRTREGDHGALRILVRDPARRRPVDDPQVRRPDITTARREFGWEPTVGSRDGLARTIEWFQAGS